MRKDTRLSIWCLNPGAKRGSPGAIAKHIRQETVEFFPHQCIIRQFQVAHFCGCAILFNNHTCELDREVKSTLIFVEKAYCNGWAFEAAVTLAPFRRIPRTGKSSFTMMSLHCHNEVAQKRSLAFNVLLTVRICFNPIGRRLGGR